MALLKNDCWKFTAFSVSVGINAITLGASRNPEFSLMEIGNTECRHFPVVSLSITVVFQYRNFRYRHLPPFRFKINRKPQCDILPVYCNVKAFELSLRWYASNFWSPFDDGQQYAWSAVREIWRILSSFDLKELVIWPHPESIVNDSVLVMGQQPAHCLGFKVYRSLFDNSWTTAENKTRPLVHVLCYTALRKSWSQKLQGFRIFAYPLNVNFSDFIEISFVILSKLLVFMNILIHIVW